MLDSVNLNLSPEAARFVSGPPPARMMAARGLVPLSPLDLISVQIVLSGDEEAKISEAAKQSLVGHPENILVQAVNSSSSPELLAALARLPIADAAVEAILLSRHVTDDTLLWVAGNATSERVLEVLAGNQLRMIENLAIAEALVANEHARLSTRKRIEEFFRGRLKTSAPSFEEPDTIADVEALTPDAELTPEKAEAVADEGHEDDGFDEEALRDFIEENEHDKAPSSNIDAEPAGSLYKQLTTMPVSAKVKLALKGNKEARMLLIKDSNKMVSSGVLKNPRITDGEIIAIASSKSAIEDSLRIIAGNRMWVRLPQVRSALVHNAKTPVGIALKLLSTLPEHELKLLAKSRNVSGAISQAAKRLMAQKAKRN